jgi:hypothetical protein
LFAAGPGYHAAGVTDLRDSLPWRLAEKLVRIGRGAQERWRSRESLADQWAAVDQDSTEGKVRALRLALRGGAYDLAARLAETVQHRADARDLVAEALRVVGDPRADEFAPPKTDAEAFAARAAERPLALLANPQLHLALFDRFWPADPTSALVALNRFLRAHGLPRCDLDRGAGNLLARLRFEAPRPVEDGPLVSVLVAAHDAEATVAYAIDSILGQTWRRLEVLVCDDASADRTRAVLEERYGAEPRVRRFSSSARQGPYNVRNALLAEARGELVTFHDADDLALPTRLATQVRRLERGYAASYVALVRVTAAGRFTFYQGGNAIRPAMVSLMARRADLPPFRAAWFGADLEMREALRARHGARAIDILREPHLFVLLAEQSLTRRAGSESLENGFRSASRRAYAEAVFRHYTSGEATHAEIERVLRETANWAAAVPVRRS